MQSFDRLQLILLLSIVLVNSKAFAQINFTLRTDTILPNIIKAEYYFDNDPGIGRGSSLPMPSGLNSTVSNYPVNINGLSAGSHRLYVRTADANGHWSMAINQGFFILNSSFFSGTPALVNVVSGEYFFDKDPGFDQGVPFTLPPALVTTTTFAANIKDFPPGVHRLYFRTMDANGRWSLTNYTDIDIVNTNLHLPSNPIPGNITLLEYFFDTDPGFGKGHTVAVTGTTNLVNFTFPVDVSTLSNGNHNLFFRTFDGWSQTSVIPLSVGGPLPITLLSFTALLQPDLSVLLNWQTATETNNQYFSVERSVNGGSFITIGQVKGSGTTTMEHSYSFTDRKTLPGTNSYRLKQVDLDGHSTYSPVAAVNIQETASLIVYPIPAHDWLTVNTGGPAGGKGLIRIFDGNGKLVLSIDALSANSQQINVSTLPAGTYMLQFLTSQNSRVVQFNKL